MLKGLDLDKILDDGYGDAGYNDDVEIAAAEEPKPAAKRAATSSYRSEFAFVNKGGNAAPTASIPPAATPAAISTTKTAAASTSSQASAPQQTKGSSSKESDRKPVLGATAPPPEDIDPEQAKLVQAIDEAARSKGYANADELNHHLQVEQAKAKSSETDMMEGMEQPAPGVRKPPKELPPGAYPGDRTAVGKAYDKELRERDQYEIADPEPFDVSHRGTMEAKWVKQSDKYGCRPQDGHAITFTTEEDGDEQTVELGSNSLPWAIDCQVRKMKVGDIVDLIARGEYAVADTEELKPGVERRWRFEFISISGTSKDKFGMSADERIDKANELRLRGNELFKKGRLLRAMDYYERGSSLMDVLEAEDLGGGAMGMKPDKDVQARNKRLWKTSEPLILNWALILMKFGRWREAERKCTEILADIDVLCVKAIYRRGVCNVHLQNREHARYDLNRARELDQSIVADVERELLKVDELDRVADEEIRPIAIRAAPALVKGAANDSRDSKMPQGPPPRDLISELERHNEACKFDRDEDYGRQREAIYNQFLTMGQSQGE